jgi:hypothetical protein
MYIGAMHVYVYMFKMACFGSRPNKYRNPFSSLIKHVGLGARSRERLILLGPRSGRVLGVAFSSDDGDDDRGGDDDQVVRRLLGRSGAGVVVGILRSLAVRVWPHARHRD